MPTHPVDITIEEWDAEHPRWSEWLNFTAEWHTSSHVLVALQHAEIVGFLRFVVQDIGPEAHCPPVQWNGETLTEAKVMAFGVPPV